MANLAQRMDLRQSQSLTMTPQLIQAIRLLQMSQLDLAGFLQDQIEQNPLLESVGAGDSQSGDLQDGTLALDDLPEDTLTQIAPAAGEAGAADGHLSEENTVPDPFPGPAPADDTGSGGPGDDPVLESSGDILPESSGDDFETGSGDAVFGDGGSMTTGSTGPGHATGRAAGGDGLLALERMAAAPQTLQDHIRWQIPLLLSDPEDRLVAAYASDSLDEAGYLRVSPADLATTLGMDSERVRRIVDTLKQCEPTGVFAASLGECLALQLRERNRFDPAMAALLAHMDLLARRDFAALRRICGVDRADLDDMIAEIRALNPKPGAMFDTAPIIPVVPDVLVRRAPGGGWAVELNNETLPRLLINRRYYMDVMNGPVDRATQAWLSECMSNASWLVKSLHKRATTILKVSAEIVRRQDAFLRHGAVHLVPMNLRQIATATDLHESTVSRATADKYIATPRGNFAFRYFFAASIRTNEDDKTVSAEAIRHRIRQFIDGESPRAILSDEKLTQLFKEEGIRIARRTVAKYRESIGIASSAERRRCKNSPGRQDVPKGGDAVRYPHITDQAGSRSRK